MDPIGEECEDLPTVILGRPALSSAPVALSAFESHARANPPGAHA
jgi:hypothetical protein